MNMNCVIWQTRIASEVDRPDRFEPGIHLNHAARAGKPVKDLFLLGFFLKPEAKAWARRGRIAFVAGFRRRFAA
jgi:hypothetical protein